MGLNNEHPDGQATDVHVNKDGESGGGQSTTKMLQTEKGSVPFSLLFPIRKTVRTVLRCRRK